MQLAQKKFSQLGGFSAAFLQEERGDEEETERELSAILVDKSLSKFSLSDLASNHMADGSANCNFLTSSPYLQQ